MFNIYRLINNLASGSHLGVQYSKYAGVQLIKITFMYFLMGSCQAMNYFFFIQVFKLTGSIV